MPRGDRTGPAGMGTRTGRAAGYCTGYAVPGYANPMFGGGGGGGGGGFGRGMGRGFGRGINAGYAAPYVTPYAAPPVYPSKEQELELLKNQAVELKQGLQEISRRITELESEKPKK